MPRAASPHLLDRETGEPAARGSRRIAGLLEAEIGCRMRQIAVDMGPARIRLARDPAGPGNRTPTASPLAFGPLAMPVCTNIGNPHATFFVDDAEASISRRSGRSSNMTRCFPSAPISASPRSSIAGGSGCACGSAAPASRRACGSGACAALVAAAAARPRRPRMRCRCSMAEVSTSAGARTDTW